MEKRLAELEKKLRRLPELEIRNNILLEEKQLLVKQLMSMKQAPPPVVPIPEPPAKIFRSIGSNSDDAEFKRNVATECRAITRDVAITSKLEEPREEIQKMETIITTLRDKLQEQTLILEKALVRPVTRDVAIMHVVDKVEKPKPEQRDVAINHRTEVDNKELIDKHNQITSTYIRHARTRPGRSLLGRHEHGANGHARRAGHVHAQVARRVYGHGQVLELERRGADVQHRGCGGGAADARVA